LWKFVVVVVMVIVVVVVAGPCYQIVLLQSESDTPWYKKVVNCPFCAMAGLQAIPQNGAVQGHFFQIGAI